ncbi:RICIN domain-containing protein [Streptomyces sp. NPDC050418]|uniref:RICIN domain-containing protein n=1 Tax=Streptomyces sp. NPDC050418 TaxID=3365612 RepID=UPI0037B3D726
MQHNRCAVLAALLAVVPVATVSSAQAVEPPDRSVQAAPWKPVGPYQFTNQGAGRCLGFPAGDDRVRVWDCTTEAYQLWDLVSDGRGHFAVVNRRNGECLAGHSQGPSGWSTWLSACDYSLSNADQLWSVDPAVGPNPGRIANLSGRVLEPVPGGANESRVATNDDRGVPIQRWGIAYIQQ